MGLTNVLNSANSGLRVTQTSLDIVARNIANADTPGYTRKSHAQQNLTQGDRSLGVLSKGVSRSVDSYLQNRLRTETSSSANVNIRDEFLSRLDRAFGNPGDVNALDTILNQFSQNLQQLTTAPETFESRQLVIGGAQVLTQQLRTLSGEVQGLRQLAEDQLSTSITDVNDTLKQLEKINLTLTTQSANGNPPADLLDERDRFIDRLSEHLEIRVEEHDDGRVRISTIGGNTLLDGTAVQFNFDGRGDINANALYNTDPNERGVGTIELVGGNGFKIDLIENGILKGGRIGGLIELRDDLLVQAQDQLDELAGGLAQALSSRTQTGTAVSSGGSDGFDLDVAGLQPGNSISLKYSEGGVDKSITIVRVDDESQLPLENNISNDPNDTVIGVDFSGGPGAAATAIDAALGSAISVTNTSGTILQFLDDGAAATTDIASASAQITSTSAQDDGLQIALFVDGSNDPSPYSASLENGPQKRGFASRIAVNTTIANNNELLVRYSADTPIGDPARPLELADRLSNTSFTFSPESGIGNANAPYRGNVISFAQQVIGFQTGQAATVSREQASSEVVVTALRSKFEEATGVDIDTELADLIQLQNAFAANARVIQIASEMMKTLLQSVR